MVTTLTNHSPKTTTAATQNSNIHLEQKSSNHSVLVEKYSNFFGQNGGGAQAAKSAKGGGSTPTAGVTQSDL